MSNPPRHASAQTSRKIGGGARAGGVALLVLLGVFSTFRLWNLQIDPPEVVVPHYRGEAHFRDEAAKAHEARNKAKFGEWSLSEADEYNFWRAQSPAWVWGECLWFRAFGVGIVQARLFVVVQTIVALALLMWLVWVRHGLPAAAAVGTLLGFNWAYLVYSRLALMEGALICWLLVATLGLSQLERRPDQAQRWTAVAVVGMGVACLIKQTGLLLVPPFSVALLWLGVRAGAAGRGASLKARLTSPQSWVAAIGVAVLGGVLLMLVLSPAYQERLAFNAAHFTAVGEDKSMVERASKTLLVGLFGSRIQLMFNLLAPVMLWLATVELIRIVWLFGRRKWAKHKGRPAPSPDPSATLERAPDPIDAWMLAWALFALAANLASPHRAIRFQLVLLPPAAWLARTLMARAWTHAWPKPWLARLARGGLVFLAIGGVGLSSARFVRWMQMREPTAAQIGAELEALIGDRHAVVVGEYAAQAVLGTDYWHFYVRPGQFNTDPEVLEALGITHVVFEPTGDFVEGLFEKRGLLVGSRKLGKVHFRDRWLTVWELAPAERRAEIDAARALRVQEARLLGRAERQSKAQSRLAEQKRRKRLERRAMQCLPEELPEPSAEPITLLRR